MGEYANVRGSGERVKIGTCENMYYLRWDQRSAVYGGDAGQLRDPEALAVIRFRFPWPDEDGSAPGDFEDYGRGLRLNGLTVPAEGVEHSTVQFKADNGYLVSLPCPEGQLDNMAKLAEQPYTIHKNGYGGPSSLVQQALRGGRLVGIARCNGCHALFRLEDGFEVVAEETIRSMAEREIETADRNGTEGNREIGQRLHLIADRLIAGYQLEGR
jgi:hypothetical protein